MKIVNILFMLGIAGGVFVGVLTGLWWFDSGPDEPGWVEEDWAVQSRNMGVSHLEPPHDTRYVVGPFPSGTVVIVPSYHNGDPMPVLFWDVDVLMVNVESGQRSLSVERVIIWRR